MKILEGLSAWVLEGSASGFMSPVFSLSGLEGSLKSGCSCFVPRERITYNIGA